jgi:hypothetical protein
MLCVPYRAPVRVRHAKPGGVGAEDPPDDRATLEAIADQLQRLIPYDSCLIFLTDRSDELIPAVVRGLAAVVGSRSRAAVRARRSVQGGRELDRRAGAGQKVHALSASRWSAASPRQLSVASGTWRRGPRRAPRSTPRPRARARFVDASGSSRTLTSKPRARVVAGCAVAALTDRSGSDVRPASEFSPPRGSTASARHPPALSG